MKNLLTIILCFALLSFTTWEPNFETAKKIAREKHRLILLNFSGSDWCGPCIRMRSEIFENNIFSKLADTTLVLVNADFPRNKKNQLDKKTKKQNENLADIYNTKGKFPLTLLLDSAGKVLKLWEGLPKENASAFSQEIKSIYDAHR